LLDQEVKYDNRNANKKGVHVRVNNLSAAWNDSTLNDITFEIKQNQILGVIGPIGSGKSSLLMALLGEIPNVKKGEINVDGSIYYVSQEPWIFTATLKENILFGKEYVKEKFDDVINACSLWDDLEILSNGKDTFIGENGVNLSGGQRARVSLARALYSDADISP
jgi:ATP-binding cassette subfamily C (CFTR/MRP) protein 4